MQVTLTVHSTRLMGQRMGKQLPTLDLTSLVLGYLVSRSDLDGKLVLRF